MELSLSFYGRPNISDVHVRKILWKYLWIPIFQTKNPFFCYLGVFPQKVHFLKKNSFCERIFLRPLLTCGNTPNKFFDFFHTFFLVFFQKKIPHILEELRQLCAKFHDFSMKIRGETRVQSWTFLALFFRKRIVQWSKAYKEKCNLANHFRVHMT